MCLGDWRIGRLISTKITAWNSNDGNLVIRSNVHRVGIEFGYSSFLSSSFNASGNVDLLTGNFSYVGAIGSSDQVQINVDDIQAFSLSDTTRILQFDVTKNGNLPTKKWELVALVSGTRVAVIEHTLPEEIISAGIQQFKSGYTPWLPKLN